MKILTITVAAFLAVTNAFAQVETEGTEPKVNPQDPIETPVVVAPPAVSEEEKQKIKEEIEAHLRQKLKEEEFQKYKRVEAVINRLTQERLELEQLEVQLEDLRRREAEGVMVVGMRGGHAATLAAAVAGTSIAIFTSKHWVLKAVSVVGLSGAAKAAFDKSKDTREAYHVYRMTPEKINSTLNAIQAKEKQASDTKTVLLRTMGLDEAIVQIILEQTDSQVFRRVKSYIGAK